MNVRTQRALNADQVQSPLWLKSRHFAMRERCLLYPQKQTFGEVIGISAKGQKRTSRLVDHLVGAGENCRRNGESDRLGSPEVEKKEEAGWSPDWQRGWTGAIKDLTSINAGLAISVDDVRPVAFASHDA